MCGENAVHFFPAVEIARSLGHRWVPGKMERERDGQAEMQTEIPNGGTREDK